MSFVLLVHGTACLAAAIAAAGGLLAHRRRRGAEDEVVGVAVRDELDAGLPAWPPIGDVDPPAGIAESVSHAGVWALCRFEGAALRAARGAAERRLAVLDATGAETFLPVFPAGENGADAEAAWRALRDRRPGIVGPTWLVQDREWITPPMRGERSVERC